MNPEKSSFKVASVKYVVTALAKIVNTSFNLFISQKLNRKPNVRPGSDGSLSGHCLLYMCPHFVQGTGIDQVRVKRQREVPVLRKQNPDAGTRKQKRCDLPEMTQLEPLWNIL